MMLWGCGHNQARPQQPLILPKVLLPDPPEEKPVTGVIPLPTGAHVQIQKDKGTSFYVPKSGGVFMGKPGFDAITDNLKGWKYYAQFIAKHVEQYNNEIKQKQQELKDSLAKKSSWFSFW
jgi:hypothetical protein